MHTPESVASVPLMIGSPAQAPDTQVTVSLNDPAPRDRQERTASRLVRLESTGNVFLFPPAVLLNEPLSWAISRPDAVNRAL